MIAIFSPIVWKFFTFFIVSFEAQKFKFFKKLIN